MNNKQIIDKNIQVMIDKCSTLMAISPEKMKELAFHINMIDMLSNMEKEEMFTDMRVQ